MTLLIPHNKHLGLLSEAESRCFDIVRRYQRKQLLADLFNLNRQVWPQHIERLSWSEDGLRFLLQCAVLLVYLPFYFLFRLLQLLQNVLLFPFRVLMTYFVPAGLQAPGEKNLVGLYSTFSHFVRLDPASYVQCIDEWVPVLYGRAKAKRYQLARYVEGERLRQLRAAQQSGVMAASFRSYRAIARERLSKDLGHYTGRVYDAGA